MNLLEKFDTVEIKPDCPISEADRQFCEKQQAAYTAALYGFQELTFFWEDMLTTQKKLLGQPDSSPRIYNQYLIASGDDGPKITIHRLRVQIDALHRNFSIFWWTTSIRFTLSPFRKMRWRLRCSRQSLLSMAIRENRNSKNTCSGPAPYIFIIRMWLPIFCASLTDVSFPNRVCTNSAAAVTMPHGLEPSIRRSLSENML